MTARTKENIGIRALLAGSNTSVSMLPEAAWDGVTLTATSDLAETASALETAAPTSAVTFEEKATSADADFTPDISAAATTAPPLRQSDDEAAQGLFERLRDASKLLSEDERAALRDHLVLLHTPLVEHCARSLASAGEPLEDLIQEGYVGLIKAVDRFNPAKGARFSTYAYHLIAGEIRHYRRDLGNLIHEPGWHFELRQKVTRTSEQLTQKLGRAPGSEEVADALNLPPATVREVLGRHHSLTVESLASVGSETGTDNLPRSWQREAGSLGLQQVTVPFEEWVDNQLLLQSALPRLSELERRAIELFFYAELSKTEIARQLGISVNYAAYLVQRGLKHLRQMIEESESGPLSPPRQRRTHRAPRSMLLISRKKTGAQPVAHSVVTPVVALRERKPVLRMVAGSGAPANATRKLVDPTKNPVVPLLWHSAAQQIEVPPAYRNNVAALPEFTHWLQEEVRRIARSTPELCLVWYQVRGGYNTMTRLDAVQAGEAVGAAQALARRYGRNVAMIKCPASGTASKIYFCVAAPHIKSDEDILVITSPANFTQHINVL